jgi:hypothetical protein
MGILDKIISAESSGNLKEANKPNKTSSALGLGQFVNGTWLDMIKRYRHDLAEGKSDAEILELRKSPDLSREMTARYAAENEARLRRAGVPVTPTSTYLMHFAGPGGGVKLLKADLDTPVESILDANAIQANPFLRGKTASWVVDWANKKMAGAVPQPAQWGARAQPVPSLAQTQIVEPAFDATSWPQRPASPNVLPPDAVRRIAGAPSAAPIPFVDGATQAQSALDNSLPAPGSSRWDLSDRFGQWRGLGGAFGPASSGGSSGLRQTGDGMPSLPPVRFPLEALLAPDSSRALSEWASSPRGRSAPSDRDRALDQWASSSQTRNASPPEQRASAGLLGIIEDYMRNNGD